MWPLTTFNPFTLFSYPTSAACAIVNGSAHPSFPFLWDSEYFPGMQRSSAGYNYHEYKYNFCISDIKIISAFLRD